MAVPDGSAAVSWLVLVYRLPPKTGALKATLRRRLDAVGAVYVSRACAAVPSSGPAERMLRRLRALIADAGGAAVLLRAQALAGEPELTVAFNAARDREYEDIVTGCGDAVQALEVMAAACEFRCEQLWDMEARLKQLTGRYHALRDRDPLGAEQGGAAALALARSHSALHDYARGVYATDSAS
ncbi:Chromate resistance protein ChrB [Trebonia sp.]|uniref:Chromate resistance protein ChrB n=1 Tax=Trebonia sp. TaxID=2767075 RepID=UPI00260D6171|nr:Chromate resistance protein ChrB [Trebonia sp.]